MFRSFRIPLRLFLSVIVIYLLLLFGRYIWKSSIFRYSNSSCNHETSWQREEILDFEKGISVRWNIEENYIYMLVAGKTKGWLGIGLSSSSGMTSADIVIGWVKNGKPYLEDRFSPSNTLPFLDDKQDYELLDGRETKEFTSFCFRRKLDTCDRQDYKIKKEFTYIIWAANQDDPIDEPFYHNSSRGSKKVFLLDIKPQPFTNQKYIDFKKNHVLLQNNRKESYSCTFLEVESFTRSYHLVGLSPLNQEANKHSVRYINIFECDIQQMPNLETSSCFHKSVVHYRNKCSKPVGRWTSGSDFQKQFFPSNIGIPFELSKIYMMEIYYNFSKNYEEKRDNSGLRLHFTDALHQTQSAILLISFSSSFHFMLPPHQKEFIITALCDPTCTKETFPANGIRIFGFSFFARQAAIKMKLRHFRENIEFEPILDDHFNADFQDVIFLKDEIHYLPDDRLVLECTYNTMQKKFTTLGYFSPEGETCQVFIYYYPPVPLRVCQSTLDNENFLAFNIANFENILKRKAEEQDIIFQQQITNAVKSHSWKRSDIKELQYIYQHVGQTSKCLSSNDQPILNSNFVFHPTIDPYDDNDFCNNITEAKLNT